MLDAKRRSRPEGTPARPGITSAGSSLRIGRVALTVRDLDRVIRFYQDIVGLNLIDSDAQGHRLGVGRDVLLDLRHDPQARPADRRHAGLFHTAFLLPDRAALADWLVHAAAQHVQLDGASDHLVSEALYLTDPEGNGIEIYRDRSPDQWTRTGDRIEMFTRRLNLDDLLSMADGPWQGAPDGSSLGHVHLQVGDLGLADDFFAGDLALTRTFDAQGGAWYGWNGYHHHLAGNIWNSRGAGPRSPDATGLAEIVLTADPGAALPLGATEAVDPWGTRLRLEH